MDDARRVLAAAVVADQPAAVAAVLAAVVVAAMPSTRQLEKEAAEAGSVADPDRRGHGVKVRMGRVAAVDANLAARDAAAHAIQVVARRRLLSARPPVRPPLPPASRLVHVGTVFFDGVHSSDGAHSARVRACLSQRFAGGLPLVGWALPGVRLGWL